MRKCRKKWIFCKMKIKSVRGLIIHKNELVVLFRRKNGNEYYSVPGGGIEMNESKEEALTRELFEELNIKVKINKEVFTYENDKAIEYFFTCDYISGTFELNGEEKERNCENNYYEVSFIPIKNINNYNILKEVKNYYDK